MSQMLIVASWFGVVTGVITLLSGKLEPLLAWLIVNVLFWPPMLLLTWLEKRKGNL